jgi:hypothetical protein
VSETRNIKVKRRDGVTVDCFVEVPQTNPARLIFSGLGFDRREFLADDVFDALVSLRAELEGMGAQLLCTGPVRTSSLLECRGQWEEVSKPTSIEWGFPHATPTS